MVRRPMESASASRPAGGRDVASHRRTRGTRMRRLISVMAACAACHPNPDAPEPASSLNAAASATAAPAATSGELSKGSFTRAGTPSAPNEVCVGPCDRKYATRELESALARRQAAASSCYTEALRTNPRLSGRVSVIVRVGVDGKVCSTEVKRDELGDSGVAECAAA